MKRLIASLKIAVMAILMGGAALAFDLSAMTDAERQAFRDEIRAYLLDNPEVLVEAIGVLEERQAQAQIEGDAGLIRAMADQLFNDGVSFVGGNPEGDLTIVEFIDYRCGYCRRAHPEVAELLASDGNIRFIVKEYPVLGNESVFASRFATAVKLTAGDEAYYNVHNALIAHNGQMNEAAMRRISREFGIDADAAMDLLMSDEVSRILQANRALGGNLGVTGTPSFVIGEEMLRGYAPLDAMRAIVARQRQG